MAGLAAIKEKLLYALISSVAAGATGFTIWTANAISEMSEALAKKPDVVDVRKMIAIEAPYVKDRELVIQSVKDAREQRERIITVIDRNTEAINLLKVELARIQPRN